MVNVENGFPVELVALRVLQWGILQRRVQSEREGIMKSPSFVLVDVDGLIPNL